MPFVVNSDAHYIEDIGKHCNMYMERRNWEEIKWLLDAKITERFLK